MLKIYLFWFMIHVERTVRNENSICADVIEDTLEIDWNDAYFCIFQNILQLFWTF